MVTFPGPRKLKGGLHPKKKLFFVSNDTMKGPESRKKFFLNYKNLCHCENTPFMHIRIREKISNGPVGRGLRDVTRRQYIKYSTGKLLFLPSGLTIKKQGEWLQRSVLGPPPALARPADEVSIG